jgi:hypothetical protein
MTTEIDLTAPRTDREWMELALAKTNETLALMQQIGERLGRLSDPDWKLEMDLILEQAQELRDTMLEALTSGLDEADDQALMVGAVQAFKTQALAFADLGEDASAHIRSGMAALPALPAP